MSNLVDILREQAKNYPDRSAIIAKDEIITFKFLNELVDRCATYLYLSGVRESDIAIHLFEDELLIAVVMLASAKIGATMLSISKTTPKKLLNQVISDIKPKYLISNLENFEKSTLKYIYLERESFESIDIDSKIYIKEPKAPWQIVIGSGTTGNSKLFEVSHKLEFERVKISKKSLNISEDDRIYSYINLNYNSTKIRFLSSLYSRATYSIESVNFQNIVKFLQEQRVTLFYVTVFHIENILKLLPRAIELPNLRVLSIGASTVSDKLREEIKLKFTSNLYVNYGTNDVGGVSSTDIERVFSVSNTVGKVIDGVEVEIVDESGNLKPIGEIGDIRVKSLGAISKYLNNKEATKKAFRDGWFYTGDIGKFNEDGELIHLGRADNMMIMNGINIYPSEIENLLLKHKDVEEVIAFPIKDKMHQDIPACVVKLKSSSNVDKRELMRYAFENLGSHRPQVIEILDKIPKNEQGKVKKRDLIDLVDRESSIVVDLKLEKSLNLDLTLIDSWFVDIFKMELKECRSSLTKRVDKRQRYVVQIVWRFLLLRKKLLETLSISISTAGDILKIEEDSKNFTLILEVVRVKNIPTSIFANSFKMAIDILINQIRRDRTSKDIETLFEKINREFITLNQTLLNSVDNSS